MPSGWLTYFSSGGFQLTERVCWVECVNLRSLTGPDGAVREGGRVEGRGGMGRVEVRGGMGEEEHLYTTHIAIPMHVCMFVCMHHVSTMHNIHLQAEVQMDTSSLHVPTNTLQVRMYALEQ